MSDQKQQSETMPTSERIKTLAGAMTDALVHEAKSEPKTESGAAYTVDPSAVEMAIEDWPDAPKRGAQQMIEQYGPPNEATPTKLYWYRAGPWKRIEATRDVIAHNFPAPHSDFLTQYIDYKVPPDKFDEIARFDGSCLLDRTSGETGARCDSEAANTLTLNLMHDIVTGTTTADEARKTFANEMIAYTLGRSAPYAERLQFEPPDGGTEDLDESVSGGAMVTQTLGKAKDLLTGSEREAPQR